MVTPNCSDMEMPAFVGPKEIFRTLGHWSTAMYIILALHFIPVMAMSILTLLKVPKTCPPSLRNTLYWLISIPPALLVLTALGIIIPSFGKYIETALEIVLCTGLVKFLQFSMAQCGGKDVVTFYCIERDLPLAVGSPPFICLLPCNSQRVTKNRLSLVMWGPSILLAVKIAILAVDLIHLLIGYKPSGYYLDVDNIHNILNIPAGLIAIYFLNIYISIINDCLQGNSKRLLGTILLVEYILFDCLRLFFIFLTGTGMLTCVPPFLSQDLVVHLLKNIMKGFLATFIGFPFLNICGQETTKPQLIMTDGGDSKPPLEVRVNGVYEGDLDEHALEAVREVKQDSKEDNQRSSAYA